MTQVARKVEEASDLGARERALSQAAAQHEEAAQKLEARASRTFTDAEDARAAAIAAGEDRAAAAEMRRAAEVVQREVDSRTLESETKMKVRAPERNGSTIARKWHPWYLFASEPFPGMHSKLRSTRC